MQNPSIHLETVEDLIAQSPALSRYADTVRRLDRLLAPPSPPMLLAALRRLLMLEEVLAWSLPVLSDLDEGVLDQLIEHMSRVPGMQVGMMDPSELRDHYPVWATLIEHDPKPDAYTCLHGLLILVAGQTAKKSLRRALGSAIRIRGARLRRQKANETLLEILQEIPFASTPEQFFEFLMDYHQRLASAKPALHQLLISDIPDLLGWVVPELRPDPEGLDWTPPTPVPLPPTVPVEPWEPEDEYQTPDEYLPGSIDTKRLVPSLRAALISIWQRIHGGNQLLIPEHISSLRTEEARYLADWLFNYITKANSETEPRMVTGAAILTTMLVTGRTAARAAGILETALSVGSEAERPTLDLQSAQLIQPVLIPKSAYCAEEKAEPHLLKTTQTMRLTLPPRYVEIVKCWKSLASSLAPTAHWKSIYPVLSKIRQETDLDYTEGRVRHTLSCHTCEMSGDPVQSIWITGNDARHSLAPAHYCVVNHADLANTYAKAVWPIFQPDDALPQQSGKILVGAQTCPTDEFVIAGLQKLFARVHSPTRGHGDKKSLSEVHNTLVDHITTLLVVLTGHRPGTALHELTRWNFDLHLGVATYEDKQSDPAHFYCPVALGRILTNQLVTYEHHLAALRNALVEQGAPKAATERVDRALSGETAWFFHLDQELKPCAPSLSDWKELFSTCFPDVPLNIGRSYLARKLRTMEGSHAEYAYLQLTHFSIIGYPYIAQGPTAIADMARTLGPLMDRIVKQSLKRIRVIKGLYRGRRGPRPLAVSSRYLGIRSWELERQEHEQTLANYRNRLREKRKEQKEKLGPDAKARFFRRMEEINPQLAAAMSRHLHAKRIPPKETKYSLRPEDIEALLSETWEKNGTEASVLSAAEAIALRNYSHRALSRARNSHYYSGPLPRAEIRLPSRFRTEFIPRMFAAEETMRRLRNDFFRAAPRDLPIEAAKEGITAEEWQHAYLAAVLVVYGGVTHRSRLLGLMGPECEVQRHPVSSDAILIQYSTEPPHVWALWQAAAVVYMQMQDVRINNSPNAARISQALEHLLPKEIQSQGDADLLDCLLDTAEVSQLTSLSSMARASLHPETGSWSLLLQRQMAWLSNTDDFSEPQRKNQTQLTRSSRTRMPRAKELRTIYEDMLPLMPRANKDVLDQEGKVDIPHETHRRYRHKVIERIRSIVSTDDVPELAKAMGEWVCQMYSLQKSEGTYVLAESTIYNYFSTVGSGLVAVLPTRGSLELDDDEYTDLYAALLETKPPKSRKMTGRELRNFHSLLVRKFGAPELDWSELADYLVDVPDRVDAQTILSREAEAALGALEHWATGSVPGQNVDRRLVRQSYLVLLLLILTGCRISEITGLQHRDVYELFGRLFIRIRPNLGRGTKSNAAKRILDITDMITQAEKDFLLRWQSAEKRRLYKKWRTTTPLFLDIDTNRAIDRDLLRKYVQMALRQSTAWPLVSHHIRHGLGGRMQLDFGLQKKSVLSGVRMDWPLEYVISDERELLLPRTTKRYQVLIGHASDSTTNRSYGHTPWIYLELAVRDWHAGVDSRGAANAADVLYDAGRKLQSRYKNKFWPRVLDRYIQPTARQMDENNVGPPEVPALPTTQMRPEARYLAALAPKVTKKKKGISEKDYVAFGLDETTVLTLRQSAEDVVRSTGIAFFPRHADLGRKRASMVPETAPWTAKLWGLLDSLDSDPNTVGLILATHLSSAALARRDLIRLPRQQAHELRNLIEHYCPELDLHLSDIAGAVKCDLKDPDEKSMNHWLAWILALMAVIMPMADLQRSERTH